MIGLAAIVIIGVGFWIFERNEAPSASWLFSHTADGATLEEKADGGYTLTMTGIDPHVMAFTDRPEQDASILDAQSLVQLWPKMFADAAPNAALVEHSASGENDSVVLTLSNPELAGDQLTFDASLITEEHPVDLARLTRGIHTTPPSETGAVSLFIDDVGDVTITWTCQDGSGNGSQESFAVPSQEAWMEQFVSECSEAGGLPSVVG